MQLMEISMLSLGGAALGAPSGGKHMNKESWQAGFLAKLAPRFQTKLLGLAHSFRYPAGTTIFREGDPSVSFYLVKSGRVALDIAVPGQGAVCLVTVGPGDIFSWSALLESHAETATARAIEEVEVLEIKGEVLQYLCWEDTELGIEFYRALAEVIAARLTATRLVALDASVGAR